MNEAYRLRQGAIGILPTDTLYGLVASARNERAIERLYALKKRMPTKKCITLISSIDDLDAFGISLAEEQKGILNRLWPGPVSIVLPCGIAFRLPGSVELRAFLKESGPLLAPSANPEGLPPAETIEDAKNYFGDNVDFYIDGGKISSSPSTLVALDEEGAIAVLRQGSFVIPENVLRPSD